MGSSVPKSMAQQTHRRHGVSIRSVSLPGPLWDPEVRFFSVATVGTFQDPLTPRPTDGRRCLRRLVQPLAPLGGSVSEHERERKRVGVNVFASKRRFLPVFVLRNLMERWDQRVDHLGRSKHHLLDVVSLDPNELQIPPKG